MSNLRGTVNVPTRFIYDIAYDIEADCKGKSFYVYAEPYVSAMKSLGVVTDSYYADSAEGVLLYALSNLTSWKGETARTIKAEIKALLKGAK